VAIGDLGKVAVVVGVGPSRGTGAALGRRFARERLDAGLDLRPYKEPF
jgi:hypothetical protein